MEKVELAVDQLKKADYTHKYFWPADNTRLITQVPIYFKYKDLDCKGLLDGIVIDDEKKTILPYDLKSSSWGIRNFPLVYKRFKYYRQAAFYQHAVLNHFIPEENLQGYELLPFTFIVTSSKRGIPEMPIIYKVESQDFRFGMQEIDDAIEQYKWHVENNYFDMSKEQFENSSEYWVSYFSPSKEDQIFEDETIS